MSTIRSKLFRVCPKTGRIVGVRKPQGWMRFAFPIMGFSALVWFLVRVAPKPSRAAYPCQRVAMPLASGFVLWLAGIGASSLAFRKARVHFRQARYVTGIAALAVALMGVGWAVASQNGISQAGAAARAGRIRPSPGQSTHRRGQGAQARACGVGARPDCHRLGWSRCSPRFGTMRLTKAWPTA